MYVLLRDGLQTGLRLVIGFSGLLQNVTTNNYSSIANSHTLQFTAARTEFSQSAVSSPVDVPLLPGSRPRKLAAISHQSPALPTAVSALSSNDSWPSLHGIGMDRTENTSSNSSSIIACVSVAAITYGRCLQGHYSATAIV
jgi:hypothetical protein